MAMTLSVLLGALGLAFDLGRMFIVKGELQAYSDAAALAAVYQLDGTRQGLQNADQTALRGPFGTRSPAGYNFNSASVSGAVTAYATTLNGTYVAYSAASVPATNSYAYIRVTVAATVPVSFLGVIRGIPQRMRVTASATAGQRAATSVTNGGLAPFMPDAHSTADRVNWGFVPGGEYTLKWGNASSGSSSSGSSNNGKGKSGNNGNGNGGSGSGNSPATTCSGDAGWSNPNPTSQHGFVDIGQGNSNSRLRTGITYGTYPNPNTTPSVITPGMTLSGVPGNRGSSIFDALQERVNQDTDTTSVTYPEYVAGGRGNGRRVITVVVADPSTWSGNGNGTAQAVGFSNFFLATHYSGTSDPICAYYIGPGSMNGAAGHTDATKIYSIMLFR